MSELQVEHISRQDGRALVYRLRGVLGESTRSYEFLDELRRQIGAGPERIILNLEHVEYISSSGAGVIAAAFVSAQRAGKSFALVAIPRAVERVLGILGFLDLVEHYATEDEAVRVPTN